MSAEDAAIRAAMAAHKAGRLDEAEAGYRGVLRSHPTHPKPFYYLGLLYFHRGDTAAAVGLMRQCVQYAPNNRHAWNALGGMLMSTGAAGEAKQAYKRVTETAPDMGEGWYNLAICLRNEGDLDGAIAAFRTGMARQADYTRSHEALGALLYEMNRGAEAAQLYRDWAARDPTHPVARHMAAATSQQDVPRRAGDEYVRALFDLSAATFDSRLAELNYRAPELVVTALAAHAGGGRLARILDAGCGTGLCGPLLREHGQTLIGVDLSPQMIERARMRNCYDELIVAELSAFMRSSPDQFDAVVSADTLVYFGELEEPLHAARQTLRAGGLFVFTVEALAADADYRLGAHGRYLHSESYLRRCVQTAGFALLKLSTEVLRLESAEQVVGYCAALRA